ncbi:protein kinase domain-containing protein [Candidatus Uabimicrobium amorphum]|uniref:non-specific serine/threonine protein kinase n=1 Tax=Uabimicrobium amorphum TaxID=2596890 RepID=A0A5S9INM8_UABAM|nr:serine/threonine-protein kinase [Candidatus Uabimicrobium amorphum]BBM85243.1 putative serine/threonine-protein kinase PknB [Candidatus Uabimicrobium amorphum]
MMNLQNDCGCVLRNRYEIKELLDEGGMSSVYIANDTFWEEDVVVKVVQIPQDEDELQILSRMQREYKILHSLDHPNIVKARDFFVEEDESFLVMEYIKASSLRKVIVSQNDFLTFDQKVKIMIDLLATVSYVNQHDIIHRDLKPSNILIDSNLNPVLVDFGISKPYRTDFETLTKGAAVMGTYDYMSPEHLNMQPLTFSDVFSLGAVLYQLFTWKKNGPFHGTTPFQISRNIISGNIAPLVDVLDHPQEDNCKIQKVSDVLQQMMEKKPEDRIQLDDALEILQSIANSTVRHTEGDALDIASTNHQHIFSDTERYKNFELIGKGSMGKVYKVWDEHLQKEVAMKTLMHQAEDMEKDQIRFTREAKITKELQHPYIVEVYDFGSIENNYFFTMEFLEGRLLFKILEEGEYSYRELIEVFVKICQAVEHAHSKKCIHRDLKPENILILENGDPKVTDFGLAKFIPDWEYLTTQGCVMGTASYMSPEQAKGDIDDLDERTDIYALGIILYVMLTGTFPFSGQSTFQIISQTILKDPTPAYEKNPRLPKSLSDICMKAIAKDKENRYQDVAQLRRELTKIMVENSKS